jgi:hypothetical protein
MKNKKLKTLKTLPKFDNVRAAKTKDQSKYLTHTKFSIFDIILVNTIWAQNFAEPTQALVWKFDKIAKLELAMGGVISF